MHCNCGGGIEIFKLEFVFQSLIFASCTSFPIQNANNANWFPDISSFPVIISLKKFTFHQRFLDIDFDLNDFEIIIRSIDRGQFITRALIHSFHFVSFSFIVSRYLSHLHKTTKRSKTKKLDSHDFFFYWIRHTYSALEAVSLLLSAFFTYFFI